jgi:formate hydrogenlyase transcriptional activator
LDRAPPPDGVGVVWMTPLAHAVLRTPPMTTLVEPLDTVTRNLDRLSGVFVSTILSLLDQNDPGRAVEAMLQQIGEALAVDHAVFESRWRRDSVCHVPRVWTRPGSMITRVAAMTAPALAEGRCLGELSVGLSEDGVPWPPQVEERLSVLAGLIAIADRWRDGVRAARRPASDLENLRVPSAETPEGDGNDFEEIIGNSAALRVAMRRVLEVAPTDASVVIVGETGTGKELFARAVHNRSRRRGRPFVRVNCAALPPTLIESELFGHERGAFTGAVSTRRGRFELAHTGTLFLDEIGDLLPDVQAKLLRVLQEGEFERVGSSESRRVDVRIVAATHHDLETAVKDGRFRADLYYRLSVFPIALPPLRERIDDIPRLAWFFVNRRQRALNRRFTSIPPAMLAVLQQHQWPGNVRELENVIERAMIHSTGSALLLDEGSGPSVWSVARDDMTLEQVERRHIETVLKRCHWRVNGPGNAAEILGLHPNTLRFRMKKLGVHRPSELGVVLEAGRLSA